MTTDCRYCKFLGERHTATNAIATMVMNNFMPCVVANAYLGWKHRIAPEKEELLERETQTNVGVPINYKNTLFVLTTRHPLTWLRAMHREPYCWHQPELKKMPFKKFIQNPIEDYRNPMVMWNAKYHSYIRFSREVPHSFFLSLEDFVADQYAVYEKFKTYLPAKGGFTPLEDYVSGKGTSAERKAPSENKDLNYSEEELSIVKQYIDPELVERFGYSLDAV